MTRIPVLIAAVALPLLLAGCGSSGTTATDPATDPAASTIPTGSPSSSSSPFIPVPSLRTASSAPSTSAAVHADWPACASVWTSGQTLPRGYAGCESGGADVVADSQPCSFGKAIVTYAGTFYAVPGGPVNQTAGLKKDPTYQHALASCTG